MVDVGSGSVALSGDAPRHRHAEPGHLVERRAADPGFGFLGRQGPGAQAATDDGLVARHCRLPKRPSAVAGRFLPSHAPLIPDQLDVAVPLAGRGAGTGARRRGRAWRDDHVHRRVGLMLGHGPVDGTASSPAPNPGCAARRGRANIRDASRKVSLQPGRAATPAASPSRARGTLRPARCRAAWR